MDDPFEIRPASAADVDRIVPLAVDAAAAVGVDRPADVWRDMLTRDVEHPDRLLVLAATADEVVGYARAHLVELADDAPADHAPAGYYLIGLFVRPDRRRASVGSALVETRLRWIAGRADEAWFFTAIGNAASIALHRHFGFEEVTRRFSFRELTGEHILFRARVG